MLANSLKCVIAQMLCRRKGKGRTAAFELMYVTSGVANLIREQKSYQLPSIIQTGKKWGMMTMNDSLLELIAKEVIDIKEGYAKSTDKADMNSKINGYMVEQVKLKKMTVDQALQESFFKLQLVEFLRQGGFAKAVQNIDVSKLQEREEAAEMKVE